MPVDVSHPGTRAARVVSIVASVAMCLASVAARAQTPDTSQFQCNGRVITAIDIQPHGPSLTGREPNAMQRFLQHVVLQSATTRERTIRSFLLARVGDKCDERKLEEIARVIRAQPYLAAGSVLATDDGSGGVHLTIETVDELPIVIGGGYSNGGLTNLTYGNSNIDGVGLGVIGRWRSGGFYRDGFTFSLRKYGVLDKPIVGTLDLVRNPLGGQASLGLSKPFLSDLQHIAWYAGGTHSISYRPFVRADGPTLSLPLIRDVWAAGAVSRIAWRSAGLLVGPVVTYERSRPDADGVIVSDSGLLAADTTALQGRYAPFHSLRVGATVGLRVLGFLHVQGFDALMGEQDVARGFQLAGTAERGIGSSDADRSTLVSADFYAGGGTKRSFMGVRVRGEGLREQNSDSWSATVLSGRAAWYVKPSERRTFEASAEFSGGWRERVPLQLSLGDPRAGVRGYKDAPIAGGRRAVLRLEQRQAVFSMGRAAQLGAAIFTDVGKTWAGSVPFGETTVARASVGVGLLAAVPPRSRRMIRADVALPVTSDAPKTWLLRVSVLDKTRVFWRDPSDLAPVRAGAPSSPIFGWP